MDGQQSPSLSQLAARLLPWSLTHAQVRDLVRQAVIHAQANGECLSPANIAAWLDHAVKAGIRDAEPRPTVCCDNCERPISLGRFLAASSDGTVRMATCRVCRHQMTLRPRTTRRDPLMPEASAGADGR